MAMYEIILAALGADVEQDELIRVDRMDYSAKRLEYNLEHLWAWNIRGITGYQADAPAVFIEYA